MKARRLSSAGTVLTATLAAVAIALLLLVVAGGARPASASFSLIPPPPPSTLLVRTAAPLNVVGGGFVGSEQWDAARRSSADDDNNALKSRRWRRRMRLLPASSLTTTRLLSSLSGDSSENDDDDDVLLRLTLSAGSSTGDDDEADVLEAVRSYVRSFPFAAVLPVQPLTYIPTYGDDGDDDDGNNDGGGGGVKVTFLRKKTKEKGTVDGGIDFDVRWDDTNQEEDDEDAKGDAGSRRRISIVATRNAEGQTVSKTFSEMIVVKAFVKGLSGQDDNDDKEGLGKPDPSLAEAVRVESVFHRWMVPQT